MELKTLAKGEMAHYEPLNGKGLNKCYVFIKILFKVIAIARKWLIKPFPPVDAF